MSLEGASMSNNYSVWRNGNSLVLVDKTISESCRLDMLNIQLAAYLAACNGGVSGVDGDSWLKEYIRVQSGFGCTLATLRSQTTSMVPVAAFRPWTMLCDSLLQATPHHLREAVAQCLEACASSETCDNRIGGRCDLGNPLGDTCLNHAHAEVRLVLPDYSIISTQLNLGSRAPLDTDWLWQSFDPPAVQACWQFQGQYLIDSRRMNLIGPGLAKKLQAKLALHRSEVSVQEPNHD
ncbi:hypothetical protein Q9323_02465 [Pseudomonas fulva]|uniref:hypothetical protein n=1 Tax=Pseudomonas fulva TaxID=47880 RepID=UPI0031F66093